MQIEIEQLSKVFQIEGEEKRVLQDLTMTVKQGEFVCILGYTGSGKSTLLRILAGLEQATSGRILIDRTAYTKPSKDVLLIFQDYNQLLPWKTVIENVTYPLHKVNKSIDKAEAFQVAANMLTELGLGDYFRYYPHQISGGMRQRVALARALVLKPKVLLMDEPFAALDEITRQQLQRMCLELFAHNKTTVVFVTHSIEEAITLADRIFLLDSKKGAVLAEWVNECKWYPEQIERRQKMKKEIFERMNGE